VRVIGIDPGLATTGYGVVERAGGRLLAVDHGVVATRPDVQSGARLAELRDALRAIIAAHTPAAAALESLFFNANVKTAMAVGQASGIALLCAAEAGLEVARYTPTEVKASVVGVGNASKRQVGAMAAAALGLAAPVRPADAADACAVAICHLNRSGLARAIEAAL
jgi:crossover junction endodeoxyribonuclease RuvC